MQNRYFLCICSYSQPCLKANIVNAIHESSLHSALISGNASAFRRCALELLGINCGDDDAEESSSDGIASDSNSDGLAGQSTPSSSSEDSDDGGQETCTDVPVLPPPVPCERRVRDPINAKGKMKFCSAFQSRCCGDHSAAAEVPQAPGLLHKTTEDEDGDESTVASSEDFSDISDDSDLVHLTVDPHSGPHKTWWTEQDQDQERIEHVASLLRKNPLLPPDPADPTREIDWRDVQSGIALPRAHCGFKGCKWVDDKKDVWEDNLKLHVKHCHLESMQLPEQDKDDFYDFYEAAIQWQAQHTMPAVGVSIDRRSFRYVNDTFNDDYVYLHGICSIENAHWPSLHEKSGRCLSTLVGDLLSLGRRAHWSLEEKCGSLRPQLWVSTLHGALRAGLEGSWQE